MEKFNLTLKKLENILSMISATTLFIIMIIVVFDVLMRYVSGKALFWSYELISVYLLVIVFFFALSSTLTSDSHIAVDILHIKLKSGTRHLFLAIGYWLSSMVFALILITSSVEAWSSYVSNGVTDGIIEWPLWLSWAIVPIGVSLLLLRILFRAIGHTLSFLTRRDVIDLPLISGYEKE